MLSMGEDIDFQINLLNIYLLIVSAYAYAFYAISNKPLMKTKPENCSYLTFHNWMVI